jgi:hypothetical protein
MYCTNDLAATYRMKSLFFAIKKQATSRIANLHWSRSVQIPIVWKGHPPSTFHPQPLRVKVADAAAAWR